MDKSVEILRTGDFWIDLGISYVWQYLISRGSNIKVNQEENKTTVEILNEKNNLEVIAIQTPPKISMEYSEDIILKQELVDMLETIKPHYLGISKKGKEKWDRQGLFFSAITVRTSFFEPPRLDDHHKRSADSCAFCGSEKFALKQTGATNQPLMANPGKFSSFYSNLRGDVKICEMCIFVSKFSPSRIFYRISKGLFTAIAFESNDLIGLNSIFKEFSEISVQSIGYRNFRSELEFTMYPLETFFDFLFSVVQSVERKKDLESKNLIMRELITRVHIIQGTVGRTLSLDKYYVIPNMPRVLDFISKCRWSSKKQKTYNSMLETARWLVIKRERETETTVREEFARRMIYNADVTDLIERFLISRAEDESLNQFVRINLDKFIRMYSLNQLRLDYNQLRLTERIGNTIGSLAAGEEKSLLYDLRSIANLDRLIEFFHRLLVRYSEEISQLDRDESAINKDFKDLLDELENRNWRTYKSLIGIYSALKFSELTNPQPKNQTTPEIKA